MENLNKRQLEFVRLLLEEKEYRSIQYFAQKLEVSDKTLAGGSEDHSGGTEAVRSGNSCKNRKGDSCGRRDQA